VLGYEMPSIITPKQYEEIKQEIMKVQPYSTNPKKLLLEKLRRCLQLDLGYYLGLRPDTIRKIEIRHINFQERNLYVPRFNIKTRKDETFYFPDFLFDWLKVYLKQRCKFFKNSKYLFPSNSKYGICSRDTLSKYFKRILQRRGLLQLNFIDKAGASRMNLNLYSLRHSFGTRVYQKTKSIKQTAIMLGQTDPLFRCASRYVHICDRQERKLLIKEIYN